MKLVKLDNITTWEIPDSWCYATLVDFGHGKNAIVDGPFGSNLKTSDYINDPQRGIPVLTTKNLEGNYSQGSVRYISQQKYEELKRSEVKPGDILVAKIGSVGKTGIYPMDMKVAIIPANLLKFTVAKEINFKYVYAYLNYSGFQKFIQAISTATAQPAFNLSKFKLLPIPLPPLPEQHRIVTKIDELISELDKGIESFKTAREQLKVYRQALLKHAFEGKLTAAWREENVGAIPTGRPDVDYSEKHGRAVGVAPTKRHKDLPPLTAAELEELPELPNGWGWVKLGSACSESILGKMLDKEKNKGTLKPYLRNINVRWSTFDLHNLLEMRFEDSEQARYCLTDGDLVICEGGEPGRCAVWRQKYGCEIRIQKALHRVRFPSSIKPDYVQKYFELYSANNKIDKYFTGTTIKHLTGEGLSKIPLPICLPNEQTEILNILDEKLSEVDQLDQTITTALQQAEALRQSILKKAFSGQLVPQDPNDEPASVLLARIKAERAVVGAIPTGRPNSRTKNQGDPPGSPLRKPIKSHAKATK